MKTKFIFALMLGLLLVLGACKEKIGPLPSDHDRQEETGGEDGNQDGQDDPNNSESLNELDGHEYVDLGLPSGTLWAICNVGANSPEVFGDFFAWGETQPKTMYNWSTYKYGELKKMTKYCSDKNYGLNGFTDNLTVLVAEDDAATANWGDRWCMPTEENFAELKEYCTRKVWYCQRVEGIQLTSPNGNTLFFPATGYWEDGTHYNYGFGYYWSSSLSIDYPNSAIGLITRYDAGGGGRQIGRSVRPIVDNMRLEVSDVEHGYQVYNDLCFYAAGGKFIVTVKGTNKAWTVSCSQPWVKLSTSNGTGYESFSVLVLPNESSTADDAVITVTNITLGVTKTLTFKRSGNTSSMGSISGHDYVDLGLPSGTLWATCNIGADAPEEIGDYFAWGETLPKSMYDWSTYKWSANSSGKMTKYCSAQYHAENGFHDDKYKLEAEDDAATANWGSSWCMPGDGEINELIRECNSFWTTQGGINGRVFAGRSGGTLFLPAAGYYGGSSLYGAGNYGYYWSRDLKTSSNRSWGANNLDFSSERVRRSEYGRDRYCGLSVRPVVRR